MTKQPFADKTELARAARLFLPPGTVCELRALNALVPGLNGRYPCKTLTGYFDDPAKLVSEADRIQSATGCYVTLNPVDPRLLARAQNRLVVGERGTATGDGHIVRRRFLLIDADAQRPAGISASGDEHEAAKKRARSIYAHLKAAGWPDPVVADSGNGCHLLYFLDLPADDGGLVERCLRALDLRFTDDLVKVDTVVHNPSRIVKLYGTRGCKGDNTPDRPHRMSKLLSVPDELLSVPRELLEALAAEADDDQPDKPGPDGKQRTKTGGTFDLAAFIAQAGLEADGPEPWDTKTGRGQIWQLAACPFNADHTNRSAYIGQLPDGPITAGCQHESCTWGWAELRARFDANYKPGKTASDEEEEPSKSQATLLVELAKAAELWHTPGQGDAYGTLHVDGHWEHWPIRGRTFRRWLSRQYYVRHKRTPGSQAVQDALGVLEGEAIFAGQTCDAAVRVAQYDGRLYLDLCDDKWRSVEIDAGGWRLMKRCPVRFRRAKAMMPLPVPEAGGSLDDLRRFVNVSDDDWPLVLGWLVAALRPTGPYPVLALHGEQGSAKSTVARVLRELVDPNSAPVRCEPREPRDLAIAASNGWVVAVDNLSFVSGWLSDALCRLATGGGFATRTLYENDEETIFNATRPTILTGIEEVASRSDLLDRCLLVQLPRIPDDMRRAERIFWPEFHAAKPGILGAVLDAVVSAIVNLPSTKIDRLPRMADFAEWATAAEPGLGLTAGQFMASYRDNRESAHAQALESSPVVPYVLTLDAFTGRAGELLAKLDGMATDADKRLKTWPKTPRALGGMLRRLAPDLRTAGVDVTFGREAGGQRRRFVTVTRLGTQSTVPIVPIVPTPGNTDQNRDGRDANGAGRDGRGDANTVDVSADEPTAGTVRDGRDDEMQPCSSWAEEGGDDDAELF